MASLNIEIFVIVIQFKGKKVNKCMNIFLIEENAKKIKTIL